MALIECPECGELISEKATKCPHCGITKKEIKKKHLKDKVATASFPIVMLIMGIVSYVMVIGHDWSGDPFIGDLTYWAYCCGQVGLVFCLLFFFVFIVRKKSSKTFRTVSIIACAIFILATHLLCSAADDWTSNYIRGKCKAVTGTYRCVYKGSPVIITIRPGTFYPGLSAFWDVCLGDDETHTYVSDYDVAEKKFVFMGYDKEEDRVLKFEIPEGMSYFVIGDDKYPLKKISNKILVK